MAKAELNPLTFYRYEIHVGYDSNTADQARRETYFRVRKKYAAIEVGHEQEEPATSTMFFERRHPLNIEKLTEELEGIEILQVVKR